ncbi:MAG: glycoside hydrolase family 3 protein [Clostridia bacterium]|nr:glycoside hydrolase family 3 protein [Clostridia bacterium]
MKKLLAVLLACALLLSAVPQYASAKSGKLDEALAAETRALAVEIEAEGVVLLKNEDGALPLRGKRVNVFGAGSVLPFYGGAGSGAVTTDDPVSFYEALETAGVAYNPALKKLYESHVRSFNPKTDNTVINNLLQLAFAKSSLEEMPAAYLTDRVMREAKAYSDTALVVISRTSAEGRDLSADTLRLTDKERALMETVTASFPEVIVLFNTGNLMETGWLDTYPNIKAAMLLWIPGEFGLEGAAKVLSGEISPSGKLADTAAYRIEDHPSSAYFGTFTYDTGDHYVEYCEGIYTGYRYFETFAPEKVQYPFGYGLSYAAFEKTDAVFTLEQDAVRAAVTMTNTGGCAGKEVAQLYYCPPYTPGGIEKSAVSLGAFAKTRLLQPGESERVELVLPLRQMASYDQNSREAYVLEAGDYRLFLGDDVRSPYAEATFALRETVYKTDDVTGNEIHNLFGEADNGISVLSRANGVLPPTRALAADDAVKNKDALPAPAAGGETPKTGAAYGTVITLRDVAADETKWEAFLDQLTLDEMIDLVIHSGYETQGVERLGIPATEDNDGPSSVKGRHGLVYVDSGTAYPCETAIACTWNAPLAERMGEAAGREAADMGEDVWYAPGMNLHRNPMGGRNFEYFSEDPLLTGVMGAAIVAGANRYELVTTVKHFALNDQEAHRNGLFTWADEQTIRELYLKAFEPAVKQAGTVGVMSAYNRLGACWCGGSSALLKDLLRTEWGFNGYVISDYSSNFTGSGYMSPVNAVYGGGDTMLTGIWSLQRTPHVIAMKQAYARDPVGFGKALRESVRHLCEAKMRTKAFLHPERTYDDSFIGSLDGLNEWEFTFPYLISVIRYILNNLANVVIYAFRYIL